MQNINKEKVEKDIYEIAKKSSEDLNYENLKIIFNCIDLTSLNLDDNEQKIKELTQKVSKFKEFYPDYYNVAAICSWPHFVKTIKDNLTDNSVKIACVAGSFPFSQTFFSIKLEEISLAINRGADEIDIVFPIGKFLNKQFNDVANEISVIKSLAQDKVVKVILETGFLKDENLIYQASLISMECGADFIKTSTGKYEIGATYEAVYTMCLAIKDFYEKNKKMVGIKPSGGINSLRQSLTYFTIVKEVLGELWLNNKLFRIGTSKLANIILTELNKMTQKSPGFYF